MVSEDVRRIWEEADAMVRPYLWTCSCPDEHHPWWRECPKCGDKKPDRERG